MNICMRSPAWALFSNPLVPTCACRRGSHRIASLPWRRPLRPIQIRVDGVLRVLQPSDSRRDLSAQGSIDPSEHLHCLPKIEEELRNPTGSPISDEGSLRDLAARHSITARSNPPSPRDRRPVRRRDAEANGTNGRRVRVLRRHYGTMVNFDTVAKMTPEQEPVTQRDADPKPLSSSSKDGDPVEASGPRETQDTRPPLPANAQR